MRQNGLIVLCLLLLLGTARADRYFAYFGTYTGKGSHGIYVAPYDSTTGKAGELKLAAEVSNPSFLTVRPGGNLLAASSDRGPKLAAVVTYAINHTSGELRPISDAPVPCRGLCHVSFDRMGKYVFGASYSSGEIFSWPVTPDGTIGPVVSDIKSTGHGVDPTRQEQPHAHQILPAPQNDFVFVCDLGLDTVDRYRLDGASGTLTEVRPFAAVPPGGGARHLAFAPSGRFAYVANEMGSAVTVFAYSPGDGEMRTVQTVSTLPPGFTPGPINTAAEVAVHPSGKFLYVSERGPDTIAAFTVDQASGKLTPAGHYSSGGKTPRFFTLDPAGRFLLAGNQNSANVVLFQVNQETGTLTPTGQELSLVSPVCIVFVRAD